MGYALYGKFSELVQLSYILSFYIPVNPCFPIFSTSSILINLCPTELWGVLTWRNLISSFACYDQVVVTEVWQKIEGDRKCEDHAAVELWECGACLCAIFSSEVHVDAIVPIFGAPCHSDQEKKVCILCLV